MFIIRQSLLLFKLIVIPYIIIVPNFFPIVILY